MWRKPSSKLNNIIIVILLIFVFSPLKGRVFLLTFETTQNEKTTQYIAANIFRNLHLSIHIEEELAGLRIYDGGF